MGKGHQGFGCRRELTRQAPANNADDPLTSIGQALTARLDRQRHATAACPERPLRRVHNR